MMLEKDRNGLDAHAPGAKLDAGKPRMTLIYRDMVDALEDVARVGTFGAHKYSDKGWAAVPNAEERYFDALVRHMNKLFKGEVIDPDSGLSHYAHLAWNALAISQIVHNNVGLPVEPEISKEDFNDLRNMPAVCDLSITEFTHLLEKVSGIEVNTSEITGIREVAKDDILDATEEQLEVEVPTPEQIEMSTLVTEATGLEKSGSFLFTQEDIDLMSQGRLSRRLKDMDLTKDEVQDILRNGFYEVVS